jgi:hypothetical protein
MTFFVKSNLHHLLRHYPNPQRLRRDGSGIFTGHVPLSAVCRPPSITISPDDSRAPNTGLGRSQSPFRLGGRQHRLTAHALPTPAAGLAPCLCAARPEAHSRATHGAVDGVEDTPDAVADLLALGLQPSPHAIQPRRSIVIDLAGSADDVLARMKQKTRYNIRLSEKKGVSARLGTAADLPAFNALMHETGSRDGFGIHAPEYYAAAFDLFAPQGQATLALAEFEGRLLAAVMAFAVDGNAWYLYGASSDHERQRMAPYLAQWAAIEWARKQSALTYDLWGVPDADEEALEAGFETRRDGLWGVYRFKRGWGGRLTRTVGAWDRVFNPWLYRLYTLYMSRRATGE